MAQAASIVAPLAARLDVTKTGLRGLLPGKTTGGEDTVEADDPLPKSKGRKGKKSKATIEEGGAEEKPKKKKKASAPSELPTTVVEVSRWPWLRVLQSYTRNKAHRLTPSSLANPVAMKTYGDVSKFIDGLLAVYKTLPSLASKVAVELKARSDKTTPLPVIFDPTMYPHLISSYKRPEFAHGNLSRNHADQLIAVEVERTWAGMYRPDLLASIPLLNSIRQLLHEFLTRTSVANEAATHRPVWATYIKKEKVQTWRWSDGINSWPDGVVVDESEPVDDAYKLHAVQRAQEREAAFKMFVKSGISLMRVEVPPRPRPRPAEGDEPENDGGEHDEENKAEVVIPDYFKEMFADLVQVRIL